MAFSQLTTSQEDVVAATQEPGVGLLVLGVPGSGKTTTLVEAVAQMVSSGSSLNEIVVLTHVRSAAQQLRSRIIAEVGASVVNPHITTPYGFCLALQSRFSATASKPALLTVAEQLSVVQELLSGFPIARWPDEIRGGILSVDFAAEIREISARARQLGLDPRQLSDLGVAQGREEWVAVGEFLEDYLDVLDFQNALDYSELVHRTRLLLLEPGVEDVIRTEIKAVFCDEFSEFDTAQVKLLADLHKLGIPVIAFADPSTRVFGFRGAEQSGVRNFEDWFPTAKRLLLPSNLRSSSGLVAAQNRLLSRLGHQADLSLETDETICAIRCPDQRSQVMQIAANLRREKIAGRAWSEMAVINRSASGQVAGLAKALEREGIPVRVTGDALPLSEQPAVRVLLSWLRLILDLASERELSEVDEARIIELLRSPLCGLSAVGIRQVRRLLRSNSPAGSEGSTNSLLINAVQNPAAIRSRMGNFEASPDAALDGLMRLLSAAELLHDCVSLVLSGSETATVVWQLWNGTAWPQNLRSTAVSDSSGAIRANRDLDAVIEFFDFIPRAGDQAGKKGLRTLLSFMENQQIANDSQRESRQNGNGVAVLTAHRTKGESWPYVVLASADEGNWPRIHTQSSILSVSELGETSLETQSYQEQVAAERRLFLLALSRAEEKVLITSLDAASEESLGVSRFVGEMELESVESDFTELPLPANEFIASLRRTTTSVGASPALRRAAAAKLAELAALQDPTGKVLFAAADPINWWIPKDSPTGDRPEKIQLSASAVEAITQCPRQYFLNRLEGDGSITLSKAMGTIFHAVAEHRQLGDIEATEIPELLDEAFEHLPVEPSWKLPFEREEADQMMLRFEDWLRRRTDRCIGSETSFLLTKTISGVEVEIRGTVDRLELTEQRRLRVVDFKTGRNVPSAKETESNVQLGIYQYAVSEGCFADLADGVCEPEDPILVYVKAGKTATERSQTNQKAFDPETFYRSPEGERLAYLLKVYEPDGSLTQEAQENHWVYLLIQRAVRIVLEQDFQASRNRHCRTCAFQLGCPAFVKGDDNE